jgi:hypothetical protein
MIHATNGKPPGTPGPSLKWCPEAASLHRPGVIAAGWPFHVDFTATQLPSPMLFEEDREAMAKEISRTPAVSEWKPIACCDWGHGERRDFCVRSPTPACFGMLIKWCARLQIPLCGHGTWFTQYFEVSSSCRRAGWSDLRLTGQAY